MRRSTLIALLIALAIAGWLASPYFGLSRGGGAADGAATTEAGDPALRLLTVRTRESAATPVAREVVLNGRSETNRTVRIAAEISGRVVDIQKRKGEVVAAGELVVQLDRRDRETAVAQARATLEQRRIEDQAARRLGERGFQAETQVAAARAALELARYNLESAEMALAHTAITAPFAGILDDRPVELGTYVDIGDTVGLIVDLDPIVIVADVPEASIGHIRPGSAAEIRLADGSRREGRVRYVARQANELTRTFRIEAELANPDAAIPAGITTEIAILLDAVPAHPLSPGSLVLADDGRLGIKSVDAEDIVHFHEAEIVKAEVDTVWLGGLPERLRVITVGQGFVEQGQHVRPSDENAVAAIIESVLDNGQGAP